MKPTKIEVDNQLKSTKINLEFSKTSYQTVGVLDK